MHFPGCYLIDLCCDRIQRSILLLLPYPIYLASHHDNLTTVTPNRFLDFAGHPLFSLTTVSQSFQLWSVKCPQSVASPQHAHSFLLSYLSWSLISFSLRWHRLLFKWRSSFALPPLRSSLPRESQQQLHLSPSRPFSPPMNYRRVEWMNYSRTKALRSHLHRPFPSPLR